MASMARSRWPCWKTARTSITAVDVRACRRVSPDRRLRRLGEKIAQRADAGGRRRGILRAGEGEDAPAAVRLDRVAEVNRLGVRQTDDRRRMEAHADHEAFGQMLMRRLGGDERRLVSGRRSRRVASVLDEISLHLGRIDAFAVGRRLLRRR